MKRNIAWRDEIHAMFFYRYVFGAVRSYFKDSNAACKLRCWMGFSGKFGIDSIKVKMKLLNENMEKMGETAYKKAIKAAEEIAGLFCVSDKMLLTISCIFEQMKEVTHLALQKILYFIHVADTYGVDTEEKLNRYIQSYML